MTTHGQLKTVWRAIFIINAANVSVGIRGPSTWSLWLGVAGLILSVLALRSFRRDERREQVVKVFE